MSWIFWFISKNRLQVTFLKSDFCLSHFILWPSASTFISLDIQIVLSCKSPFLRQKAVWRLYTGIKSATSVRYEMNKWQENWHWCAGDSVCSWWGCQGSRVEEEAMAGVGQWGHFPQWFHPRVHLPRVLVLSPQRNHSPVTVVTLLPHARQALHHSLHLWRAAGGGSRPRPDARGISEHVKKIRWWPAARVCVSRRS